MRSSSRKDLAVFDYDKEEEAVEAKANSFVTRIKSRLKSEPVDSAGAVDKYTFLQVFGHSGMNVKQRGMTDLSCVDLHESESTQVLFAIDSPERNVDSIEEKSELDEIMASTRSYEERGQVLCESEAEAFSQMCSHVMGGSSLAVPSLGNRQVSQLQFDGMLVDVLSDEEESWTTSRSPSTSGSNLLESEACSEHPVSDNCHAAFGETDTSDMPILVSPDYVMYGNTLYEESELRFYSNCIKIQCLDTSGNEEKISSQWAVADIIHIDRQWTEFVGSALVKFQLRSATLTGTTEEKHDNCEFVKLIFGVTDVHWLEKEQKIKSLAARYEDIWNASSVDVLALENIIVRPNMYFPKHYFTEIPDSFEDVIYPKGDPDAVSISKRDIELLQPDTFINDTIIDFYIKHLKSKIQPNERHRFHFFNSFFFRKLADLDKDPVSASEGRAAFQRVRKWTRKVNVFEKDYIFVPVNFNLHWSLLVICHPGEVATFREDDVKGSPKVPCILHMDSIKGSHSGLKNLLQSYLWEEWKERHPESADDNSSKFSNLRFVPLELPQQENSFDCGLFLLHYVELFLEDAPVEFNPFKINKFSNFLTVDWFSPAEASFKRSTIRKLIYELFNDASQRVTPACSSGDISPGYCENDTEQEPAIEFLSAGCSTSQTVLGKSGCSVTESEAILSATSHDVAKFDKEEGLVMREERGATIVSSPECGDQPFMWSSSFSEPEYATCLTEEYGNRSIQIVTSSLGKDEYRPVGGSRTFETCTTSYSLKDVGEFEMSLDSLKEKDEDSGDSLPVSANSDHLLPIQSEAEKPASALGQDCGYVPESPISSSLEKLDDSVEDSQEIDTKAEGCGDCESQAFCATEAHGGSVVEGEEECLETGVPEAGGRDNGDCEKINTAELDSEKDDACQEIDSTKKHVGHGEECQITDTAREAEGGSGEAGQETNTFAKKHVGGDNHQKIDPIKEHAGDDEECQIIDTATGAKVGSGEDCLEVDSSTEAEGGSGEYHQEDTATWEDSINCGIPRQEALNPLQSCHSIVIADDESSLDMDVHLKRGEPSDVKLELQCQKRRRIMQSEGCRMRTRSFKGDCPS